nr:aldehyde dehydrogenase (NADP(+)) [Rhodococcus wratislaviensis]GLK33627.1 aldehyde dehydrogenase [Rhodococcus wratislaviensis]
MKSNESRPVTGVDPRTGTPLPAYAAESTFAEVDAAVTLAAEAAPALVALGRAGRAELLRALADALETSREKIISVADSETALGPARLGGELSRTTYQLQFFAEVLEDGGYLEATIDLAGPTPMGPRPDLRRMLVPIGPVAVFGASNFPLAFSVPGGDTVSALAAGSPVVVKAHGSHPGTSKFIHEILQNALKSVRAPIGALGLVFGRKAGERLVAHPSITAVGFTGSLSGGKALLDIINSRPRPIPFYGELSSLNALIITPAAARERAEEIGTGLADAVSGSAGQLCTKPGLVVVPAGEDGDTIVKSAATALNRAQIVPLLNHRIHTSYLTDTAELCQTPGVVSVPMDERASGPGYAVSPLLVTVEAKSLPNAAFAEYFGPAAVIARYSTPAELAEVLDRLPSSLTVTLHLGADEKRPELIGAVSEHAGRIVFNGYPTGVAVSWAQHHGGPWPATNSLHTSVGATAIRRFLRPLTWQNAPAHTLPDELTDKPTYPLPRRINGQLQVS